MIEIVHQYKKDWSMFTLASLLGKADNFARIHLYVQEQDWEDAPIQWAIDNFDNIKIYQSWWKSEETAKMVCHLKNYWADKSPGLNKRILVAGGNSCLLYTSPSPRD